MKKILISGPESSGKSYLASNLAIELNGTLVEEYARAFLTNNQEYVESDLIHIAQMQYELETKGAVNKPNFLVCDTGIEVVCIWSSVKYGRVDDEIKKMLDLKSYDLILLCKPNIPWEFDVLREHSDSRDELFVLYQDLLHKEKVTFQIIDAPVNLRLSQAANFLNQII